MPPKRKSGSGGSGSPKKTKTSKNTGDAAPAPSGASGGASSGSVAQYLRDPGWKDLLEEEFSQPYFQSLDDQLAKDYGSGMEIFPPKDLIFNAFNLTPLKKVKLVLLGQDPYHDNGQAHGLSFSVPKGIKAPPSLVNIYKELATDIPGFTKPDHGNLEDWARQGVLMLNATLTVQAHKPNSHAKYGWQKFTDNVIKAISNNTSGVVFILWGGFAQKKEKLIDGSKHSIIKTAHPSPLSVTKFLGCKCFSQANKELKKHGKGEIDWSL